MGEYCLTMVLLCLRVGVVWLFAMFDLIVVLAFVFCLILVCVCC